jgi:hypothetical protein
MGPKFRRYVGGRDWAGGTAEALIDGVNETIDSMTNTAVILIADWFPGGEMAVEQWHINNIFIDLRGRDFRGLNREFVSRRRASLDPGTDVTM